VESNEAATYLKRSAQKLESDITALTIFFVRSSFSHTRSNIFQRGRFRSKESSRLPKKVRNPSTLFLFLFFLFFFPFPPPFFLFLFSAEQSQHLFSGGRTECNPKTAAAYLKGRAKKVAIAAAASVSWPTRCSMLATYIPSRLYAAQQSEIVNPVAIVLGRGRDLSSLGYADVSGSWGEANADVTGVSAKVPPPSRKSPSLCPGFNILKRSLQEGKASRNNKT
jgi:hypothetical protein